MTTQSASETAKRPPLHWNWRDLYDRAGRTPWAGILAGLGLVAFLIPILIAAGGYNGLIHQSLPLVFLVPTLVASGLSGRMAGIIVSFVCVVAWDWFFLPPLHTFTVYYPRDLLALVIFIAVAILTGQLATLTRRKAGDALRRARTTEALYDLSTALIGSRDISQVLPVLTQRLRATFDLVGCSVLLREEKEHGWRTAASSGNLPDELNLERSRSVAGILAWVEKTGQMSGMGHDLHEPGRRRPPSELIFRRRAQFWPLKVGNRLVGVLELVFRPGVAGDPDRDRLLTALVNGAALALEHERLLREESEAAVSRESDRLKSVLLSSVSHDLRSPLAGIKAAASSLLQDNVQWSDEDRRAFIVDIDAEADRLSRFVSNLLDLSRIEAGALNPMRDWVDVGELLRRVAQRLQPRLSGHHITLKIPAELPPVYVDPVHIEQTLTNLIENAAKYAPEGTTITADAAVGDHPESLTICVIDEGPGIPDPERHRIFEKFYRLAGTGRGTSGAGMGLAIVKGLVEANRGTVSASRGPAGVGSCFTIRLPVAAAGSSS